MKTQTLSLENIGNAETSTITAQISLGNSAIKSQIHRALTYKALTAGKTKEMLIGYAPGAYDLFHVGHLNMLKKAKQQCDYLVAGVVSDEMLLLNKGITPVIPLNERLEIVRNVRFVDDAVAETLTNKVEMWKQLHFDILFKGDDWKGTEKGDRLEKSFGEHNVKIVYFPYTQSTSSSLLRKSLAKLNGITAKTESRQTTEIVHALSNDQPTNSIKQGIDEQIPFYKAASLLFFKPRFQKALQPSTNVLASVGITANQVTIFALLGSIMTSMVLLGFNSHSAVFCLLPLWLFLRMGFNTVDGLLAIGHGQKSRLGGILNEGGDILSDLMLAAPLALIAPANQSVIFLLMGLSVISEIAGIAGSWLGGKRCNFGPFGKTDRTIALGSVGLWLSIFGSLPQFMPNLLLVFIGLHAITIFNRVVYLFSLANSINHHKTAGLL